MSSDQTKTNIGTSVLKTRRPSDSWTNNRQTRATILLRTNVDSLTRSVECNVNYSRGKSSSFTYHKTGKFCTFPQCFSLFIWFEWWESAFSLFLKASHCLFLNPGARWLLVAGFLVPIQFGGRVLLTVDTHTHALRPNVGLVNAVHFGERIVDEVSCDLWRLSQLVNHFIK